MRGVVIVALSAAALSGIAGASPTAEPAPAGFRLVDGSVACSSLDGAIACRGAGAEQAVVLEPDGDSYPADLEVGWDASTPVLLTAESWWHGSIVCRVRDDVVFCSGGGGTIAASPHGIGGAL